MPKVKLFLFLIYWIFWASVFTSQAQQDSVKLADFNIRLPQAEPIGGYQAYFKKVRQNLRYPTEARKNKIEGKVFVSVTVQKDGTLTDFKVAKGLGYGCDEEALRLVKTIGKWKAGRNWQNEIVAQRRTVPIVFKLK